MAVVAVVVVVGVVAVIVQPLQPLHLLHILHRPRGLPSMHCGPQELRTFHGVIHVLLIKYRVKKLQDW